MKRSFLLYVFVVFPCVLKAQTEPIQSQFIQSISDHQAIDEFISKNGYLFFSDELILNTEPGETDVILDFQKAADDYRWSNTFINNSETKITVGSFKKGDLSIFILTGWSDIGSAWKKEVDVVLEEDQKMGITLDLERELDKERTTWEELANAHDPLAHTNYSYAGGAVYLSGGRRNDGPEEIAQRYSYMENPAYSVYLEDIFLKRTSEGRVVEIGRYSIGSRDSNGKGMYLIVWEKQPEGRWQIALDFNF